MSSKLSIIIGIYDRTDYIDQFMQNNIISDIDYFFVDGFQSSGNASKIINYNYDNVYVHSFPDDKGYLDYYRKIRDVLIRIKSDYVMIVDDDDLILKQGVVNFNNALKSRAIDPSSVYQGWVLSHWRQNSRRQDWLTKRQYRSRKLSLENCLKQYFHIWYAFTPRDLQIKALNFLIDNNVKNGFLAEEMHTFFILSHSPVMWWDEPTYSRLQEPGGSTASANADMQFRWLHDSKELAFRNQLIDKIVSYNHGNLSHAEVYAFYRNQVFKKILKSKPILPLCFKRLCERLKLNRFTYLVDD